MNIKKIMIIILTVLIVVIVAIPERCYAVSTGLGDLNQYHSTTEEGSQKLKEKANIIFLVIRSVGMVISVVTLIVIGIKYMIGSVEEKANYKETLLPYLVGAILLFTGSLIPQLIYDIMKKI